MQGITVYQRTSRPCWFVAYTCPKRRKRVFESTGYRVDAIDSKLQAYAWAREKSQSGIAVGLPSNHERWDAWAESWLRGRYRNRTKTLTSYIGAWKHLSFFLNEQQIFLPRQLTYQSVVDFVHWREQQIKKRSKKKVSRNTALHNVKVLSRLMREAVRRGWAQGNPCLKLSEDVPPDDIPDKPEFTDDDITKVRAELARRAKLGRPSNWMPIAFEIALHQGCRLSACQIPMSRIDFDRWTVTLHEKGNKDFTVPVHPNLRPMLLRLRDEGRTETCVIPRFASRIFSRVLREIDSDLSHVAGQAHHSFHSTRVTVITRMARADIPEQKAMRYVHHGSWAVHRLYTKLKPADVAGVHDALELAPVPLPSAGCDSPQNPGASPTRPKSSPDSSSGR